MIPLLGSILGGFATAAFVALLALHLFRYFRQALGFEKTPVCHASRSCHPWRTALTILLAFVLSRALYFVAGYIYAWATDGLFWYMNDFPAAWIRWDAYHYIKLTDEWYVNVGDDRYKIVFYPLYPLVSKLPHLMGFSAQTSCLIVSNACLLGCGWAMHELVRHDQGAKAANRAVWLLMFCPLGFFFSTAYSESLFMLLALLAALLARKKHYNWAILCGALCSATRALGILAAPVIFFPLLQDAWEKYAQENPDGKRRDAAFLGRAGLCVLRVLPVALGLIAYLVLNYVVTGDPFTFLVHQKEHWGQTFGSLYNTLGYTFDNALTYDSIGYRVCLWIPQTIAILGVLGLMWAAWRKEHPADSSFSVLYYYCSIAPTWLLSGTRYLAAMYSLYPILALLTRKKWVFATAMTLSIILSAVFAAMYSVVGLVL